MASRVIDLSNPAPHTGINWTNGAAVELNDMYPAIRKGSVVFAGSADIKNPEILFDGGLVLAASRNPSAQLGEVFGFFLDVSDMPRSQSIKVGVHFDVLEALEESSIPQGKEWFVTFIRRLIRIPIYRPGVGIVWRELPLRRRKPVLHQFIGGVAAVATAEDMSQGVYKDGKQEKVATGRCYIRYAPGATPSEQSVTLRGDLLKTPHKWFPMEFFRSAFNYPITKDTSIPTNIWYGNPHDPYVLELLLETPKNGESHAPLGVGLRRTADNQILGVAPNLDTSRYGAEDFSNDLATIRYAGVTLFVARFDQEIDPTPRSFGPARVRIKKLVVETT